MTIRADSLLLACLTIRKPCLRCVFVVGFAIYLALAIPALFFGAGYLAGFFL